MSIAISLMGIQRIKKVGAYRYFVVVRMFCDRHNWMSTLKTYCIGFIRSVMEIHFRHLRIMWRIWNVQLFRFKHFLSMCINHRSTQSVRIKMCIFQKKSNKNNDNSRFHRFSPFIHLIRHFIHTNTHTHIQREGDGMKKIIIE